MTVFAFDIETVPDVETGRRLFGLTGLCDEDVARVMYHHRLQKTGVEFLPLHQHRIVAISVALCAGEQFKVWSLGAPDALEPELIERFFDGIERYTPTIVSWNGSGFDLPVLHYRALLHGIRAPRYWEIGDQDASFRYNNYLSRFHWRHVDLMEVLAGFQARANAPLDEIALMLGLPGKRGMSGADVWTRYQDGDLQSIRDYCEWDVLNTYLIFLRFQLIRGRLEDEGYARECRRVREQLAVDGRPHLQEFLGAWHDSTDAG